GEYFPVDRHPRLPTTPGEHQSMRQDLFRDRISPCASGYRNSLANANSNRDWDRLTGGVLARFRCADSMRSCRRIRQSLRSDIHRIQTTHSCFMQWQKTKSTSVVTGSNIDWKTFKR